jgi:hypothetical protein
MSSVSVLCRLKPLVSYSNCCLPNWPFYAGKVKWFGKYIGWRRRQYASIIWESGQNPIFIWSSNPSVIDAVRHFWISPSDGARCVCWLQCHHIFLWTNRQWKGSVIFVMYTFTNTATDLYNAWYGWCWQGNHSPRNWERVWKYQFSRQQKQRACWYIYVMYRDIPREIDRFVVALIIVWAGCDPERSQDSPAPRGRSLGGGKHFTTIQQFQTITVVCNNAGSNRNCNIDRSWVSWGMPRLISLVLFWRRCFTLSYLVLRPNVAQPDRIWWTHNRRAVTSAASSTSGKCPFLLDKRLPARFI